MGQMGIPSAHPQPRLLNATISGAEEKYTIKCICGYADDRPNTVYCERCDTWQHIECYYPSQQVPDEHFCADCLPQDIDARGAADRQRLRLKRLKRAALGGDHLGFADTHTPFLELETSKLLVAHRPKYTEILEQLDTKPSSLEFQDIIERVKVLHESADTRVESCERALRLIHEQMRDHATEQEERDRRVEERRRNRGGQRKKVESLKSVKARERRPQFTNAMPPELSPTVPAWGPFS
ncbi:uncharacterized protein HMPREF1541_00665 [Cyphellophora europaea CBS 101466]|uniref:PHD-type domain-containing protein n=1 Tax=Cyphellophora europaea (strain CBS 101466) TaxID=1220924 RepID=W2SCY5_CYPE1|nr:uncharacterized protein HMPREF1541_00665 [Cyphellophora europaea CBS 101466]ETN46480.1 hypothetical protein HMPREF1541_00665 [Cyphellophora europaea CBS 101466]